MTLRVYRRWSTTLDALIATDPEGLLGPSVVRDVRRASAVPVEDSRRRQGPVDPGAPVPRPGGRSPLEPRMPAMPNDYTDANHKPELICALTPFEACAGSVRCRERRVVRRRGPADDRAIAARTGRPACRVPRLLEHGEPAVLADLITERATRCPMALRAPSHLPSHDFPGDVGVVVTLLLNYVRLAPGEAIYLGAGNVHATCAGRASRSWRQRQRPALRADPRSTSTSPSC